MYGPGFSGSLHVLLCNMFTSPSVGGAIVVMSAVVGGAMGGAMGGAIVVMSTVVGGAIVVMSVELGLFLSCRQLKLVCGKSE